MSAYLQRIINPIQTLALVLLICMPFFSAGAVNSVAAQVRIEGDSPSSQLTIHVENANLEAVLAQLAQKFGFELEGAKKIGSEPHWSATLTAGNLETLLNRLLRNRNHSIIHSDRASGSIRRIHLIGTRVGSKLTTPPGRTGAITSTARRKAVKARAKQRK